MRSGTIDSVGNGENVMGVGNPIELQAAYISILCKGSGPHNRRF
jgi:hypothetical protein